MKHTIRHFTLALIGSSLVLACTESAGPDSVGSFNVEEAYQLMQDIGDVDAVPPTSSSAAESMSASPDQVCAPNMEPAAIVSVKQSEVDQITPLGGEALVLYRRWDVEQGWGEVWEADCIDADCTRAAINSDEPGYYLVGAFGCGDHQVMGIEVTSSDGCLLDTVPLTLILDDVSPACLASNGIQHLAESQQAALELPTDVRAQQDVCPLGPLRPAVIAHTGVVELDMIVPRTPEFIYSQHESEIRKTAMECLDEDCTNFADGWGQTGTYQITAQLCGQQLTETVEVGLSPDGCGVETEWVGLFVDSHQCDRVSTVTTSDA